MSGEEGILQWERRLLSQCAAKYDRRVVNGAGALQSRDSHTALEAVGEMM